jgi:hypothetical protein
MWNDEDYEEYGAGRPGWDPAHFEDEEALLALLEELERRLQSVAESRRKRWRKQIWKAVAGACGALAISLAANWLYDKLNPKPPVRGGEIIAPSPRDERKSLTPDKQSAEFVLVEQRGEH